MPYQWSHVAADQVTSLTLWPHRSLPIKGFAVVIMGAFLMMTVPLFSLIGTKLLWGLLPFLLLVIAGLWWGLQRSYRDGTLTEKLAITVDQVTLDRRAPDGQSRNWSCESYWVRVHMYETGGPVPSYVTLKGKGREVEIGAFLSEDERKKLFGELMSEIRRHSRRS